MSENLTSTAARNLPKSIINFRLSLYNFYQTRWTEQGYRTNSTKLCLPHYKLTQKIF